MRPHTEVSEAVIAAHKRVWTEEPIEIPSTVSLLVVFERGGQVHSQYRSDLYPRGLCIAVASSWVRPRGWGQPLTLDPTAEPMKYFWVSRKSTTIGNRNITAPAACKPTRGRPFGSR